MAQGIGALFGGPMASLLHEATGTWTSVFGVAITADLLTAVLAIAALKPLRAKYLLAGELSVNPTSLYANGGRNPARRAGPLHELRQIPERRVTAK